MMQDGYDTIEKEAKDTVSRILTDAKSVEPHPVFKPGKDAEFSLGMSQNKLHQKLTTFADSLQSTLTTLAADCKELGVEVSFILPEFEHAKSQVKCWLNLSCTYTCLKILASKAAANKTVSLVPSLEQTLDFEAAHSLEVHPSVKEKMVALCEAIKKAANPSKSSKK